MNFDKPLCQALRSRMPRDWDVVPLAEVTDFQEGPGIPAKDFVEDGVPLLRLRNIENATVQLKKCNFLDKNKVNKKWAHFALQEGDLLISTSASFGHVSVVNREAVGSIAYTGIIRFRSVSKRLNHNFLRAFLSSSIFMEQARKMATGSVIKHFGPSHLKEMAIMLPSLKEQIYIANIFDNIDFLIHTLCEINTVLETIAQTLFKSWFINFDPVRAKAAGKTPEGIDIETADLFPTKFANKQSEIPMGWKVDSLGNWLSILETGRRPKGGVGEIKDGIPSIGAESIVRIGQFNYLKTKYVPKDFFSKMKSGVLQSQDVLLYKDGGKPGVFLPRVSMFGEGFPFKKCGINEHVFRIRIKEPFNQAFLYFWLWSDAVMHELKHRGGKAAIPGINQSDVKELKVIVPVKAILDRFNNLVSPLISKILTNAQQIQTLDTLRDVLLPRLISGELRLPEIEETTRYYVDDRKRA